MVGKLASSGQKLFVSFDVYDILSKHLTAANTIAPNYTVTTAELGTNGDATRWLTRQRAVEGTR
jgi:hypothetical protein